MRTMLEHLMANVRFVETSQVFIRAINAKLRWNVKIPANQWRANQTVPSYFMEVDYMDGIILHWAGRRVWFFMPGMPVGSHKTLFHGESLQSDNAKRSFRGQLSLHKTNVSDLL